MAGDGANVPGLRFPGFEGDWNLITIGEVGQVIRGASPRPKADPRYYGPGVPRLMVEDVARDGKFVNPISDSLTPEGATKSRLCAKGTLTVVCSGTAKTVGQASFLKTEACIHDGFLAIIEVNKEYWGEFIYYQIQRFQQYSERLATHGGTFINLTTQILREFERAFPDKIEQQKVAAFLGAVDGKIGQLEKKKALLEDYKKGCMQKLFSRTLRFKDDNGNDFPDWDICPFGCVVKKSAKRFNPKSSNENPVLIELENIEGRTGRLIGHSDLATQKSMKTKFSAGDVLFGKLRPYLRKFAHPQFSGVCSSEVWVLRSDNVNHAFLFQLVQATYFIQLANISTGSKMPRADWDTIADSDFEFPHPDEQQKIANFLTAIDDKITLTTNQLTQAQNFKRGLLQQMFV